MLQPLYKILNHVIELYWQELHLIDYFDFNIYQNICLRPDYYMSTFNQQNLKLLRIHQQNL